MDLIRLIEAGATSPFLLFFIALALGALHGLEPGHSKTMMAAFIIAVRGTVGQAALLGLSAAASHTVIVWVLSLAALFYGDALIGEKLEPWFMIASGGIVTLMGGWIYLRGQASSAAKRHTHNHVHDHEHEHEHDHDHDHTHDHGEDAGDAHALAHAREIEVRFADGRAGTWRTIVFGLTGGLIPCPAAITVLVLCLHLKQVSLGLILVSAFSIGLAGTLVAVGAITAIGLRFASSSERFGVLRKLAPHAPLLSAGLIAAIGLLMVWSWVQHLPPS